MSVADQPRYAPNTVGEEEFVQAVSDMGAGGLGFS